VEEALQKKVSSEFAVLVKVLFLGDFFFWKLTFLLCESSQSDCHVKRHSLPTSSSLG
jgi:hypothetical protein